MSYLKQTTKMGAWKTRVVAKEQVGHRGRTRSTIARIYIAVPPAEGWPGGNDYAKNGLRARKG